MIVYLRPDKKLVRVNLRPYKAAGGKEEPLLTAFVHGAQTFDPNRIDLVRDWRDFRAVLGKMPLPHITVKDWDAYDKRMAPSYRYGDHSEEYEKAYQPSYRVLRLPDWRLIDPNRRRYHQRRRPHRSSISDIEQIDR